MLVLVRLQFCSGLGRVQHVAEARGVLLVKVMVTWFPFHRLNIIIQLMLMNFYILSVCSFCEYIYSNTVLLSGIEDRRATHPNIININIVNAIQFFYSYICMAKPVSHPSTTKYAAYYKVCTTFSLC